MAATVSFDPVAIRGFTGGQLADSGKRVLESAFQPIVETATGTVFGYESLMRGFEKLGFADPVQLLDKAEEVNQLFQIEQMMASRALAKFASMPDCVSSTLFINFDGRLIRNGNLLLDRLLVHLANEGIPPSSVCFELSERLDNTSVPGFAELIERMRKNGFKLAIDDFGACHAEMKLLCDYPVNYLKIDRYFISGIDSSPRKRHLVRNIVNIAHVLGIRVIAEGIETENEFLVCREYGVDLVQGWFISRPSIWQSELKQAFPHLRDLGTQRRSGPTLDEVLIRRQIEYLPAVYENDDIDTVFELFRKNPALGFFPVLNASGEPRGIVKEHRLKELIYHPFGRDLLKNRHYERSVSNFVDAAPVVGLDADAERLMNIFAGTGDGACVILTENMRYAGIVSAASLLRIVNEKQIKAAQDQNPLTTLPGNRAIGAWMLDACRDGDDARFFCYCDFDNFKPFNDCYGFHKGDHAISLFAALMRRYFFAADCFLGHIGGDDFFFGLRGWSKDELAEIIGRLLDDFETDAKALYSASDREAGQIRGLDRSGTEKLFPLLRCSVAVLELPRDVVLEDPGRISSAIVDLKSCAKNSDNGLAFGVFSPLQQEFAESGAA